MDHLSTALVAAVLAGLNSGITDSCKQMVGEAYNNLKKRIFSKFKESHPVPKAIVELESNPNSKEHQNSLSEQIVAAKACFDKDIIKLVNELNETISAAEKQIKNNPKFRITAKIVQAGVIGDNSIIKGGVHIGDKNDDKDN